MSSAAGPGLSGGSLGRRRIGGGRPGSLLADPMSSSVVPSSPSGPRRNVSAVNLPNAITVARIALVPVFLVLAYTQGVPAAVGAFGVFLVASVSDFVDGYLARRAGITTKFGEFVDPLADKLLVGAALFVLVDTRLFPLWAAVVIAVREVLIQVLRIRIVNSGGRLPASRFAKLKTVLQICMVSWWLLPWGDVTFLHWVWMGAALSATVLSGVEYLSARREVAIER
jgi:CDP-diacylglycerol---glycerol-3-phosphate 3-phosphatidyltransferase